MFDTKILLGLALIIGSLNAFPLSFKVENNSPLCFIERFDLGEVNLKESDIEL